MRPWQVLTFIIVVLLVAAIYVAVSFVRWLELVDATGNPNTGNSFGAFQLFEAIGIWLQFIVLFIAGIFAYLQWRAQVGMSQLRSTHSFISETQRDKEILEAVTTKRIIIKYAKDSDVTVSVIFERIAKFALSQSEMTKINELLNAEGREVTLSVYDAVRVVLNHYEVMALGVEHGALQEQMLRDWWMSTYINDYVDLELAIAQIRAEARNDRIFSQFEIVAKRWIEHAERLNKV